MIQEENDRERKRIVIDERRRWGKAQKRRGKGDRIKRKRGTETRRASRSRTEVVVGVMDSSPAGPFTPAPELYQEES